MERVPQLPPINIDYTANGEPFGWRLVDGQPVKASAQELRVALENQDSVSAQSESATGRDDGYAETSSSAQAPEGESQPKDHSSHWRTALKVGTKATAVAAMVAVPWLGVTKFGSERWADDPAYELPADAWEDIRSLPADVADLPDNLAEVAGWPFNLIVDEKPQDDWNEMKGENR